MEIELRVCCDQENQGRLCVAESVLVQPRMDRKRFSACAGRPKQSLKLQANFLIADNPLRALLSGR